MSMTETVIALNLILQRMDTVPLHARGSLPEEVKDLHHRATVAYAKLRKAVVEQAEFYVVDREL